MPLIENLYHYEKLKWDLLERYKAISLDEALDGKEGENVYGGHYSIGREIPIDSALEKKPKNDLTTYLQLVKGIGKKRKKKLHEKGITDIQELIEHGKYLGDSREILLEIENEEYGKIYERIKNNFPRTHQCYLSLLNSIDDGDLFFFDIETTGLEDKKVFLIGTAIFEDESLKIEQFLAREDDEEKSVLKEFEKRSKEKKFFLSYNGRRFDMNVIRKRNKICEMDISVEKPHIDLLHISKSRWENRLNDFKLSTIEKEVLGAVRKNDLPSALIPHFYEVYLSKNNIGPLIPIIEHNEKDLISMAKLFRCL